MKFRKDVIVLAVLALTGSLGANVDEANFSCRNESCQGACASGFDGFYVGVAGGLAFCDAETSLSSSAVFDTPQNLTALNGRVHKARVCQSQPVGEIYAGWGHQMDCFYLGARLGLNFSSCELKLSQTVGQRDANDTLYSAELKDRAKSHLRPWEFTFDLKPGYVFCDQTMVFALIGGAVNEETLRGRSTFIYRETTTNFYFKDELHGKKRKDSLAFRIGAGIEHLITPCLSVQLSYVYTGYSRARDSKRREFIEDQPQVSSHDAHFAAKARRQLLLLGVSYYF
jgi:opacity protein-like surface antigen